MADGKKTNDLLSILAVAAIVGLYLMFIFGRWTTYWLWYKPVYAMFPDSLYLPLYLHLSSFAIMCIVLFVVAIFLVRKPRTKSGVAGAIFLGALSIAMMVLAGQDCHNDIVFTRNEKYLTAECRLSSLHGHGRRSGNRHDKLKPNTSRFHIESAEKIDGKYRDIEMNFYQYRELQRIREADGDRMLRVHYLPNTGIMLKYE